MELPIKSEVTSQQGNEDYQTKYFKDDGRKTFTNFLKNLIKEYISRQNYPFTIPPVLGVPYLRYAHEIKSDVELLGRIKALGQLLGVEEVIVQNVNGNFITFDMNGTYIVTESK